MPRISHLHNLIELLCQCVTDPQQHALGGSPLLYQTVWFPAREGRDTQQLVAVNCQENEVVFCFK